MSDTNVISLDSHREAKRLVSVMMGNNNSAPLVAIAGTLRCEVYSLSAYPGVARPIYRVLAIEITDRYLPLFSLPVYASELAEEIQRRRVAAKARNMRFRVRNLTDEPLEVLGVQAHELETATI